VRDDDVDLLIEDAILFRRGDCDQEHAEDVVTVRLQRRSRLVGVPCRSGQEVERRLEYFPVAAWRGARQETDR
jgi:hypothetical protein